MRSRLAWLAALVLLAAGCGDAGDFVARTGPPPTTGAPPPTGAVEEWCAVLGEVDPSLPLFAGAAVLTGGVPDDVRASTTALAAAYDRLAAAPPASIAGDVLIVRDGYASFRDDLEVVDFDYQRVFSGIGQRPWQESAFVEANRAVAEYANQACGAGVVAQPQPAPTEFDDISRQFLIDALVDTGLTPEQAGCLADGLGPDLGAASGQPMAFEDAMADCGVTFDDFIPDE